MAYKQYTHCIEKSDFDSFWNFGVKHRAQLYQFLYRRFFRALRMHSLVQSFEFIVGGVFGAAVGAGIGFSYGFVDGFCDQWLNRRLICIGKDKCAIGKVAWQEHPEEKSEIERLFDNDASFNLRLIPYDKQEFGRHDNAPHRDWQQMVIDGFPGAKLIERAFNDLEYKGYGGADEWPDHPGGRWTLHCEFEGNGMVTLCTIAKVLAILGPITWPIGAAAGAIYGAIYGATQLAKRAWKTCKKGCKVPIFCDIVCAFSAALAAVTGFVGGAIAGAVLGIVLGPLALGAIIGNWINTDGSFADSANDPESGNIEDEDCVFVVGDHVYDAGHSDGWHEIHPVKHLQKICSMSQLYDPECCPNTTTNQPDFTDPAFMNRVSLFWDRWCLQYQTSLDPLTIRSQQEPENQWCLHPLIDGCVRRREPDPSPNK